MHFEESSGYLTLVLLLAAEEISYESDGEEYRVVVTALPARHCPGSIMLLIQYRELKILYTGDFR